MPRKTINIGRVKGSMWYSGTNPQEVEKPLEGDLYLDTVTFKIYIYINKEWHLSINLTEYFTTEVLINEGNAVEAESIDIATTETYDEASEKQVPTSKAISDYIKKLRYETVIKEVRIITSLDTIYNSFDDLSKVTDQEEGTVLVAKTNRGLPYVLYRWDSDTLTWVYVDDVREGTIYYLTKDSGAFKAYTVLCFEGTNFKNLSANDEEIKKLIPKKVSELENDSEFINNSVNNLVNYYLKTETYTKQEVLDLIGQISTMSMKVVDTLPTTDISTTTIYLVPITGDTNNNYEEYIYVNNQWEMIGTTKVNLDDYATKDELFSKDYNDLINKPTIPSKTSELKNDSDFITPDDVMPIVDEASEQIEKISIATSDNYNVDSDAQIPTTKTVYAMFKNSARHIGSTTISPSEQNNEFLNEIKDVGLYYFTYSKLGQYRQTLLMAVGKNNVHSDVIYQTVFEIGNGEVYIRTFQDSSWHITTQYLVTNEQLEAKEDKRNLKALAYKDSLTKSDVGLENVDNTRDLDKPVSNAVQNLIDNLSPIINTNKENIDKIEEILTSNDTDLDTLQELVNALKNNTSNINDIFTQIAKKVDKTTTVNGHALDSNVTVTKSDVGLGNVLNVPSYSKTETDNLLSGKAPTTTVNNHINNKSNPHAVTKAQIGLGNVLNVASYSKTEVDNIKNNLVSNRLTQSATYSPSATTSVNANSITLSVVPKKWSTYIVNITFNDGNTAVTSTCEMVYRDVVSDGYYLSSVFMYKDSAGWKQCVLLAWANNKNIIFLKNVNGFADLTFTAGTLIQFKELERGIS